jgi:hypothetical protein
LQHPTAVKGAKPEVIDHSQDGRRRHVENSSACYKMGYYRPILIQIGKQTDKNMLSKKSQKQKCRPISKMTAAPAIFAIRWAFSDQFG